MADRFYSDLELPVLANAPPIPSTGFVSVYGNSDGTLNVLDSSGKVTSLSESSETGSNVVTKFFEGKLNLDGTWEANFSGLTEIYMVTVSVISNSQQKKDQCIATISGYDPSKVSGHLFKSENIPISELTIESVLNITIDSIIGTFLSGVTLTENELSNIKILVKVDGL